MLATDGGADWLEVVVVADMGPDAVQSFQPLFALEWSEVQTIDLGDVVLRPPPPLSEYTAPSTISLSKPRSVWKSLFVIRVPGATSMVHLWPLPYFSG